MDIYDLWLDSAHISNRLKLDLFKKFKTSQKIWYYCMDKQIPFNDNIREKLLSAWKEQKLYEIMDKINKESIKTVIYGETEYPNSLKNHCDAPIILFYKGNIQKLNDSICISVVGARNCTFYGIQATRYIVKDLCKNNISIISGMARGIDSVAHSTCVDNSQYTCAVLGSGIDVIYPKENEKLYYSILQNGCVISEFLPGTRPFSSNFPMRNRIISGLSKLLIVVEAGQRSGTLITANCALEQGKDIVAIPGTIFSPQSKGTNKLIAEGAYPFTDMAEIFDLIGLEKYNKEKIKENISKSNNKGSTYNKLSKLINDSPIHIDDIINRCNIDIKQLYDVLFEMQLDNEIMCLSGNYYVKVHNI